MVFKPPLVVADEAMRLGDELRVEGVFDTVRSFDKLHVSIVSAGPYQNLEQIADRARKVGDQVRGNRFTFEFTDLLPFGGPTAVLRPFNTPDEAKRLQREIALGIQRPEFRPAVGLNAHMTISYTDKLIAPRPLVRKIVWQSRSFFSWSAAVISASRH